MLVFCEDCGARHIIEDSDVEDAGFQLRCDACSFLITAKSLPKRKVVQKPVDPAMQLTCSHDVLDFGVVEDDLENAQTLIFAAKDGRKIELTGMLDSKLKGNVTIAPVSDVAFRVQVVSSSHVDGPCLAEYQGPGLIITDALSRFKKIVHVSFVRVGAA